MSLGGHPPEVGERPLRAPRHRVVVCYRRRSDRGATIFRPEAGWRTLKRCHAARPDGPTRDIVMRLRIAAGLSLLVTFLMAHPAGAADKMSVSAMGGRLAAHPTGDEARGPGRGHPRLVRQGSGRPGQRRHRRQPEGRGAGDGLGHRGAGAQKAAVVTSDHQTIPLIQVGDTPVFAATFRDGQRVGVLLDLRHRRHQGRQEGTGRSLQRPARTLRAARRAQGEADATGALGEQDLSRQPPRVVGLRPGAVQGRPARLRHGLPGRRRLHGLRARPSSTT